MALNNYDPALKMRSNGPSNMESKFAPPQTVIHVSGPVSDGVQKCKLCECELPKPLHPESEGESWKTGEMIGVITSPASKSVTAYRIGTHNQDPRCDGAVHTDFRQESLPKKEDRKVAA